MLRDLEFLFNPIRWMGFHLAMVQIGLAVFGSIMRTRFGED